MSVEPDALFKIRLAPVNNSGESPRNARAIRKSMVEGYPGTCRSDGGSRVFVEFVLIDDDPEGPVVHIVSAHGNGV